MDRKIHLIGSFSTDWIRYSDYEYRENPEGNLYLVPKEDASFSMYNPFDTAESLLIEFLKIGELATACEKNPDAEDEQELKRQVLLFARKYGLLGLISSSTSNQDIIGDKEVILMERNLLHLPDKTMESKAYVRLFTPFVEETELRIRHYRNSIDLVKSEDSPKFFGKRPIVMDLVFSKFYAEKVEWITRFAKILSKHFNQLLTYRASKHYLTEPVTILADSFKAGKIGFTISQLDKTMISWEFDSLKTTLETIYAFAVTDESILLSRCEKCGDFYIALSDREKYCSPGCRNRANVQNSRRRKQKDRDKNGVETGQSERQGVETGI